MEMIILAVLLLALLTVIAYFWNRGDQGAVQKPAKVAYHYTRKQFIMNKAENEFYKRLQEVVGTHYMIYPQAHLDLFLDHEVVGQSWRGALSSIQRKSVDFLICNREYYNPLVAIELDGLTHGRKDRVERDEFVARICEEAKMPLVRFRAAKDYKTDELLEQLSPYLT